VLFNKVVMHIVFIGSMRNNGINEAPAKVKVAV